MTSEYETNHDRNPDWPTEDGDDRFRLEQEDGARKSRTPDEDLLRREEEAAAREAAGIGGPTGAVLRSDTGEQITDEFKAVVEGGGGVSEGFELAEAELIDAAETDTGRPADLDAFPGEDLPDPKASVEYGQADEEIDPDL